MNSTIHFRQTLSARLFQRISTVVAFSLIVLTLQPSFAGYPVRDGDSVWEVSSRHLSGACQIGMPLKISKVVGCGFQSSTLEEFIADPVALNSPQTVVYVHGNWMEWKNARERGMHVYQLLASKTDAPIRLVLFSWPSQREGRIAPDVREKAALAHVESYYLADFLKHIPNDQSIGMMGFSFGGAVICGALHMLGGGSLDGRVLPHPIVVHQNVKVSMVAPAFDRNQLGPCGKYEFALGQIERLVNLYNSVDPVLKRFRFIDRGSPEAAGLLGINARGGERLLTAPNIVQYDCSRAAGRTHNEVDYYRNCPSFKFALQNVLANDLQVPKAN
jgi:Alpha/beta hydrolase of unknown function (DUF900)